MADYRKKKNELLKEWAYTQLSEIKKQLIVKYNDSMYYLAQKNVLSGKLNMKMEHFACFGGGLYGLASQYAPRDIEKEEYLNTAKGIANFCQLMYTRNPTGLPTEYVIIDDEKIRNPRDTYGKQYLMRPEAVESWFILYRITKDPIYRKWGWDFFQKIEKYTKTKYGYCGLKDATSKSPRKDDVQQSFFLAETLKYLYLLFSPDDILPLDKYIFNTEAHPLPVMDYPIKLQDIFNIDGSPL